MVDETEIAIRSSLIRLAAATVLGVGNDHLTLFSLGRSRVVVVSAVLIRPADEGETPDSCIVTEKCVCIESSLGAEDVNLGVGHADNDPLTVNGQAGDDMARIR